MTHPLAANLKVTPEEVAVIRRGTTLQLMQAKSMAKHNALRKRLSEIKVSPDGLAELIELIEGSI